MTGKRRGYVIWGLALGYFLSYVPYSGLTKTLSAGLWPGVSEPVGGLQMLPAMALGTVLGMFGLISALGWWRFAGRLNLWGVSLPFPRWSTFTSGIGMATIIGTTTLAFTFHGISIVFVLILFRAGVLILGPIVDACFQRKVRWFSWTAMLGSMAGLAVTLADVSGYRLSGAACLTVAAYLTAYFVRFRAMTRFAKRAAPEANFRFFVEEQMVAGPILLGVLGLCAVLGGSTPMTDLRYGFTSFLGSPAVWPALLVGLCYAVLCVFTTFIFLDQRENTFCIPMHCCSSMLSGVVASYVLQYLFGQHAPTRAQVGGAGLLMLSTLVLAWPTLVTVGPLGESGRLRRLLLFICGGNTCRSPMAEAIARSEIGLRLRLAPEQLETATVRVLSAGVKAHTGNALSPGARAALEQLGIPCLDHRARSVTAEVIRQADIIYCMAESHRLAVLALAPTAESKTRCLDPDGDVEEPTGPETGPYIHCAIRIRELVRRSLDELELLPVSATSTGPG